MDHRSGGAEHWQSACWPLSWSAVWVGALAAIAAGLVIGLAGIAIGAYPVGAEARIASWRKFHVAALVWSVCGAFFSFVVGGWVAARMRSAHRAETAILHGVIAWLVTVPVMLLLGSLGTAGYLGAWYGGLQGTPVWMTPQLAADAARAATAEAMARNAALGALTGLLLGLVGSVIGGWMASGEPMTLSYHRTREALAEHSR